MVLRGVGACLIAKMLRAERQEELETDWLLHGPTDPQVVVEGEDDGRVIWRLAAE